MKNPYGKSKRNSFSARKSLGFRLALWFFTVSVIPLIIIPVVGTVITKKSTGDAAQKMLTFSFHQKYDQFNLSR